MHIKTLDYGVIPVRYDKKYIFNEVIDLVEVDNGTFYEIRKNMNFELVAVKSED